MTKPLYEIGQIVWVAKTTRKSERVLCPVCFGKKVVILELGDGSRIKIDCDNCTQGFNPPTGYVDGDWSWEPNVEGPYTIVSTRVETEEDETDILYWTRTSEHSKVGFNEDKVALTYDTAYALAQTMAVDQQEGELKTKREKKEKPHKSYSWHVGHHLRQAALACKEFKHHKEKARFMETKVRKPKEV